ncbi:MAG TPA: ZIP family metal transporter [Candidatus Pacearchaeota archaeon]|nr:ZIP family metal transporter [Candidatus Pacearchaeota archaeon]
MHKTNLYSLISVSLIALSSFSGIFIFLIKESTLKRIIIFLISFSIGVMLGTAFLSLIPESLNYSSDVLIFVIIGFLFSFSIERLIKCVYHYRSKNFNKNIRIFVYVNLIADVLQNFIIGIIISASYIVSIPFGISTTTALLLNELPQEVSDLAILIHGGFERKKAVIINFLSTLSTIVGGIVGLIIGSSNPTFIYFLLSFAAGNFIYIASVDLIPEINKDISFKKTILQLIFIILGFTLIALLNLL